MIESTAPLRIQRSPTSTPLMRVCAVKGMKFAWRSAIASPRPYSSLASTTIERPSGVSSAREASGRVGELLFRHPLATA